MTKSLFLTFFLVHTFFLFSQNDSTAIKPVVLTLKEQKKLWKKDVPATSFEITGSRILLKINPNLYGIPVGAMSFYGFKMSGAHNFYNFLDPNFGNYFRLNFIGLSGYKIDDYYALILNLPAPGFGTLSKTYERGTWQMGINLNHGFVAAQGAPTYFISYLADTRFTFNNFSIGVEGYRLPIKLKTESGTRPIVGNERYLGITMGVVF